MKSHSITFTLPLTTPTGPGSIIVSNASGGTYSAKSNAVSVPLGTRITVTKEIQSGDLLTVEGTGFLSDGNQLLQRAGGRDGQFGRTERRRQATDTAHCDQFDQVQLHDSNGAIAGPAFIQALNPPFLAFTSSGNDPCGVFTLK